MLSPSLLVVSHTRLPFLSFCLTHRPVTLQPLTQALKSAFNANLRKRVMMQADNHIDLKGRHQQHHHQRQSSDAGSQSYSMPNSPVDTGSNLLSRAVSQASGMSASALGTPLFPLLSSPHAHNGAGQQQDTLYRVSSAPGTLSCESTPSTPTPQSPLHSFTGAHMTGSLASSIAGTTSALGTTRLAGEQLPTIYSPQSASHSAAAEQGSGSSGSLGS